MRTAPVLPVLTMLAVVCFPAHADPTDPAQAVASAPDPTSWLGMDLPRAVAALGLPRDLFSWRGPDAESDNVVFYYPNSVYLFWFRNRVWQVRFDRRFAAPVLGFTLGMSRFAALGSPGRLFISNGDSLLFDVGGAGFPVRVRLVFDADQLTDIYVYRSDW